MKSVKRGLLMWPIVRYIFIMPETDLMGLW